MEKLHETIADIALNVGARIHENDDVDSRELIASIIDWAKEFEQLHLSTDWGETDYILTIYEFSQKKWSEYIGYINIDERIKRTTADTLRGIEELKELWKKYVVEKGTIPLGGYVPLNTRSWERMELMKHYNGVPFLRSYFGTEVALSDFADMHTLERLHDIVFLKKINRH